MKKAISLVLVVVMILSSLTACGSSELKWPVKNSNTGYINPWDITIGATAEGEIGYAESNSSFNMAPGGYYSEYDYEEYPLEGEDWNTEEYDDITENRFLSVQNNPLSTFGADVDTACYSNFRRYINSGELPPAEAIRLEEMINYFKYDYPEPENGEPFSCTTEVVQCPWNEDTLLLSIGIATESIDTSEMPPQNLVYLIDVSGSMSDDLELVKRSFQLLTDQLRPIDRVSIVTYAGYDEVVLKGATGDEIDEIMNAIENLQSGGGTNGSDGIITAYDIAKKYMKDGYNNRIILATDGDLNIGVTSESGLEDLVEEKKKSGVYLSVLGFGYGNYKDNKLETLADKGNGTAYYIDSILEARKALIEDMGATLNVVCKDTKFQVEFNPNTIKGYRLLGYENRIMAAEDFADDTKDGGELGAGHRVTVLYEIVPVDSAMEIEGVDLKYQDSTSTNTSSEFCTVNIRCKAPDSDVSDLYTYVVENTVSNVMSDNLKLASAVAEVSMLLKNSEYSGNSTFESALNRVRSMEEKDSLVEEFLHLADKAANLYDIEN